MKRKETFVLQVAVGKSDIVLVGGLCQKCEVRIDSALLLVFVRMLFRNIFTMLSSPPATETRPIKNPRNHVIHDHTLSSDRQPTPLAYTQVPLCVPHFGDR
ncbi:hypothetical protein CDAR_34321 [Caerostris darwini]|uniref:Uncharacterized protein n=1 Tax=Caerostris darwini TaxID=1538125 RepID=A0AAV4UY48_9ARAC|nr:hypothetical protein CDAR_34321 [Caerostris darwini]